MSSIAYLAYGLDLGRCDIEADDNPFVGMSHEAIYHAGHYFEQYPGSPEVEVLWYRSAGYEYMLLAVSDSVIRTEYGIRLLDEDRPLPEVLDGWDGRIQEAAAIAGLEVNATTKIGWFLIGGYD